MYKIMAKKLLLRNIFGKPSSVNIGGGGVEVVDSLPSIGEQGKIYYNTSDNKYYTYNGSDYEPLGNAVIKRVKEVDPSSISQLQGQYYIKENTLYDDCFLWSLVISNAVTTAVLNIVTEQPDDGNAHCYVFRTKIPSTTDNFNITFSPNVKIPDEVNDFISNMEAGHTYEFNIFADVLLVSDITVTDAEEDATGTESSDIDGQ